LSWRVAVALAALAAGCGDDLRPVGPAAVAVEQYDYTIDIVSRAAHARLRAAVTAAGDCVRLPMRADDPAGVELDGDQAEWTVAGGVLEACGAGWNVGDELVLDADVTVPLATLGETNVGYSVASDVRDQPFYYLLGWVGECDRFGPCDPSPGAFATYRFEVRHTPDLVVACPGKREATPEATVCTIDQPAPTYSAFGLAASPSWVEVAIGTDRSGGPLPITLDDVSAIDMADRIDWPTVGGFLQFMTDRFGPYPWGDELRLFVGPMYWGGFEHPGSIALNQLLPAGAPEDPIAATWTVMHEIAHQWAGDAATLACVRDFVWKEGMAEYLPYAYLTTAGVDASAGPRLWKRLALDAAHFAIPVEEVALVDFYGEAYAAGPMLLFHQLEAAVPQPAILDAMAQLVQPGRVLTVDDVTAGLIAAASDPASVAGPAALQFGWLRGTGAPAWPHDLVQLAPSGGDVDWSIDQVSPAGRLMPCALELSLLGGGGARADIEAQDWPAPAAELSGTASPGFAVDSAALDVPARCLVYAQTLQAAAAPGPRRWRGPE
jgi:aminopeptidase N